MKNSLKSVLIGVFVAGMVAFILERFKFFSSKKRSYNAEYTIQFTDTSNSPSNLQKAITAVEKRLLSSGIEIVESQVYDSNPNDSVLQVSLQLKKVPDSTVSHQLLGAIGKFEIVELYTINEIPSLLEDMEEAVYIENRKLDSLADKTNPPVVENELIAATKDVNEGLKSFFSIAGDPASFGSVEEKDSSRLNGLMRNNLVKKSLPFDVKFCYSTKNIYKRYYNNSGENRYFLYLLKTRGRKEAFIQNRDVTRSTVILNEDKILVISIELSKKGSDAFEQLTRENIKRPLAILLDGEVVSTPTVSEAILGGAINLNGLWSPPETVAISCLINGEPLLVLPDILNYKITVIDSDENFRKILTIVAAFVFTTLVSIVIFKALKST